MMPNFDLMDRIVKQIEEHPETWNQRCYISTNAECGTAYCFAGWACVLEGWEPILEADPFDLREFKKNGIKRDVVDLSISLLQLGYFVAVRMFSSSNTLMDYFVAVRMFSANNTLNDIKHMINDLKAKHGVMPLESSSNLQSG